MIRFGLTLIIGLVLGLAAGLVYAWELSPVEYTDISPAALRPAQRDEYVILAALAYAADGNLERAQSRLELLNDADLARTVTALAQRASAEGRPPETIAALSALAFALGQEPGPAPTPLPTAPPTSLATTPEEPAATPALPTPTGFITRVPPTATATQVFEYELVSVEKVCDAALDGPFIQALVQTAAGQPLPGVEVLITWAGGGTDHFFTGFKPELGPGYGDFAMSPDTAYAVSLAGSSQRAEDLAVEACEADSGPDYPGSWRVIFRTLP